MEQDTKVSKGVQLSHHLSLNSEQGNSAKVKRIGDSKMNGTGLTVANVTTLASKELTVELFNIMNAINEGNKSVYQSR